MEYIYKGFDDWNRLRAEECTSRQSCINDMQEVMNDYFIGEIMCGNMPKQSFNYNIYVCKYLLKDDGEEKELSCETITLDFIWE